MLFKGLLELQRPFQYVKCEYRWGRETEWEREPEREERKKEWGRVDENISLLYLVNPCTIQHNVQFKHSLLFHMQTESHKNEACLQHVSLPFFSRDSRSWETSASLITEPTLKSIHLLCDLGLHRASRCWIITDLKTAIAPGEIKFVRVEEVGNYSGEMESEHFSRFLLVTYFYIIMFRQCIRWKNKSVALKVYYFIYYFISLF